MWLRIRTTGLGMSMRASFGDKAGTGIRSSTFHNHGPKIAILTSPKTWK
jgi:hypothetical protein